MRRRRVFDRSAVPVSARRPKSSMPHLAEDGRMTTITSQKDSASAVETVGLGKRFGARTALDGVELEVPRGTVFGFLGPNGAGKTTLIHLLLGLAEPTAGRMRILGYDLPGGRAQA